MHDISAWNSAKQTLRTNVAILEVVEYDATVVKEPSFSSGYPLENIDVITSQLVCTTTILFCMNVQVNPKDR